MLVEVRGNNVDQALRLLDKRLRKSGWRAEIRRKDYFLKPSERRRQNQLQAIKRHRKKLARARHDDSRSSFG